MRPMTVQPESFAPGGVGQSSAQVGIVAEGSAAAEPAHMDNPRRTKE